LQNIDWLDRQELSIEKGCNTYNAILVTGKLYCITKVEMLSEYVYEYIYISAYIYMYASHPWS
jgi:hypothetical protein